MSAGPKFKLEYSHLFILKGYCFYKLLLVYNLRKKLEYTYILYVF
jgi:hypothetical protein